MKQAKTYKGIDLLEKIFEFTAMTPDQSQWNLAALKDNPPRQIRFRQIQSLTQAFSGQTTKERFLDKAKAFFSSSTATISIQSILNGDFIKTKTPGDYTELIDFISKLAKEKEADTDDTTEPMHVAKLIMAYRQLIKYKRLLIELLTFNSGWLESSSHISRFSIYLIDEISSNLDDKYSKLDKALELFINPEGMTFSETELIEHYNYPKDDLSEIDMNYA